MRYSKEELRRMPIAQLITVQKKYWRSQKGELVRRKDMPVDYKLNTLAWLLRNAGDLAFAYTGQMYLPDMPDDVMSEMDYIEQGPEQWLLSTPMARALLLDIMDFAEIGPDDLGLFMMDGPLAKVCSRYTEMQLWGERL